jgi:hypothetical protein
MDPLLTFNTPRCRQVRAALAKATNHDGDVVVIPVGVGTSLTYSR